MIDMLIVFETYFDQDSLEPTGLFINVFTSQRTKSLAMKGGVS